MAGHARNTPAPIGATLLERADELRLAADSIACLTDLVSDQLGALRVGVREHGADVADTAEWHTIEILLHLAGEQAALIRGCTKPER